MNRTALGVIVIGIFVIIVGIIIIVTGGIKAIETTDEGILYEDIDGTIELNGESDADPHLYVHIKSKYVGGKTGGYNERHGNDTWNLTADDCNLITNFTLKNADDDQVFIPRCDYVQDINGDDEWIVVGTLCKQYTNYVDEKRNTIGSGCKDGIYTWDSKGKEVMVYDGDMLERAIGEGLLAFLASFGACCCGVAILLIGIILAFNMEDSKAQTWANETQDSNLLNQNNPEVPKSSSAWEDKKDYIHKEKEEEEVPDKSEIAIPQDDEKKRSGDYEIPPPPET